jgi:hypothetical protein
MQEHKDAVTVELGDATLSIPTESLVNAWLKQTLGRQPVAPAIPPRIGAEWPGEGGIYAGVIRGDAGRPDYHLIVPTCDAAKADDMVFGSAADVPAAASEYDGRANTLALVNAGGANAAEWAHGLTIGPHSDFYLPARRELALMYANVPELFEKAWYWSSTQHASIPTYAWFQNFGNGYQDTNRKSYAGRARAVRRLAIK